MVKRKVLKPVSSFVLTKEQQVIYTIGYQGHYEYWYGVRELVSMIFPLTVQTKQEIQRVVGVVIFLKASQLQRRSMVTRYSHLIQKR